MLQAVKSISPFMVQGGPAIEEEVEQVETEGVDLTEGCEAPPA